MFEGNEGPKIKMLREVDLFRSFSDEDQQERTAAVTETTPCRLLVMHHRDFSSPMDEVPWFTRRVLESVVARLREADEQLVG